MTKELKLSQDLYLKLKGKGFSLTCRRCEKPLEIGDTIIPRATRNGRWGSYKTVHYHLKCWNSLFH